MSIRAQLLEAVKEMGGGNCFEIVQSIEDDDISVKTAAPELRALVAEGLLETYVGKDGRTEYRLAVRTRAAAPVVQHVAAVPAPAASAQKPAAAPRPAPREAALGFLRQNGPASVPEISKGTGLSAKAATNAIYQLNKAGRVESYGVHQWRAVGAPQGMADALSLHGAAGQAVRIDTPQKSPSECLASCGSDEPCDTSRCPLPEAESIPAVPTARKAAHELAPIRDDDDGCAIRKIGEAIAEKVFWPSAPRDELGLGARAEAVATDIEDLLGDACDAQLDHALIKALVTANGAMQRAARRLAQG